MFDMLVLVFVVCVLKIVIFGIFVVCVDCWVLRLMVVNNKFVFVKFDVVFVFEKLFVKLFGIFLILGIGVVCWKWVFFGYDVK